MNPELSIESAGRRWYQRIESAFLALFGKRDRAMGCPYCASEPKMEFVICCINPWCAGQSASARTEQQAVASWNKLPAEVKRLPYRAEPRSDALEAAEAKLAWREINEGQKTHYDGCEEVHRACALAKIAKLECERDAALRHIRLIHAAAGTSQAIKRIKELERGEYICKKCGIRKDAKTKKGDF